MQIIINCYCDSTQYFLSDNIILHLSLHKTHTLILDDGDDDNNVAMTTDMGGGRWNSSQWHFSHFTIFIEFVAYWFNRR